MSPRKECRQPCCIAPRPVIQGTTFRSQDSDAKNYFYECCTTCDSFIRFINIEEPLRKDQLCEVENSGDDPDGTDTLRSMASNMREGSVSRALNAPVDSFDGLPPNDLRVNLELCPALSSLENPSTSKAQGLMETQQQACCEDSAQPTFIRLSHPETTSVPFLTAVAPRARSLPSQHERTFSPSRFHSTPNELGLRTTAIPGERPEATYKILDLPGRESWEYGSLDVGQVSMQSRSRCACGFSVRQMEVFGGWMGNMRAWVCSQGTCGYYIISRDEQNMAYQGEHRRQDGRQEEQQEELETNEDVEGVRTPESLL